MDGKSKLVKPSNLTTHSKNSGVNVSSQKSTASGIFDGISVYVNGRTDPPPDRLKRLVLTHGGRYIYYPCKSNITHIITSNSSYTKIKELKNGKAVLPRWITDSVEAGRLLSDSHYVYQPPKPSSSTSIAGILPKEMPQRLTMKTSKKIHKQLEFRKVGAGQLCEMKKERNSVKTVSPQLYPRVTTVDGRSVILKPPQGKSQFSQLYSECEYPVGPFNQQQFNGCYFPRSTDPNFLSIFYSHSRLHHLTTWKAKHKAFVKQLQQNGDRSFPGRKQLKKMMSSKKIQNQTDLKCGKSATGGADSRTKLRPEEKGQSSKKYDPVIMHIDMDCFFVAVSLLNYPELQGKPVAVAHYAWKSDYNWPRSDFESNEKKMWTEEFGDQGHNAGTFRDGALRMKMNMKHHPSSMSSNSEGNIQVEDCLLENSKERQSNMSSIASERENFSSLAEIASCSYEARKVGVKNGMIMKDAKQLCPDLRTIPYDFDGYYRVSRQLYEIVARYTHDIEACSCDELLVDITTVLEDTGATPLEFAQVVREEIYEKTRCTASAGIASSAVLARLCTRVAKPNGIHHLADGEETELLSSVPVKELPGVGGSISKKLQSLGIFTCADLQKLTLNALRKEFGPKTGHILYQHCRGQDDKPLTMERERKYVSVEVNYGIRFQTEDDVVEFVYRLGGELHKRLKDLGMVGRTITVKLKVRRPGTPKEDTKFMGYGVYDNRIRSQTLRQETDDIGTIQRESRNILRFLKAPPDDIRGVGVQISRLKDVSSVVGFTKSLEDMLPKKKDVSKRSTSLDSLPSTSRTSENAKSYSLLNFVRPKRKLSVHEDLIKCKSKKTDAEISLWKGSTIPSVASSAASIEKNGENAPIVDAMKVQSLSASVLAKDRGKMELPLKEQSSSQPSQKAGTWSKTVNALQSLSASATEEATMYAREKNKFDLSSKEQSSSQPLQKVGTSSKTVRAFQSSSASPTEKATMFGREKNKLELSKEQTSSQPSQKVGISSKTVRAFQSSSASGIEKATMYARDKNKLDLSSRELSSSQPSQKVGTSSKTVSAFQSSSASPAEKVTMFGREKNKLELSKKQTSSQPSQKVGISSKTVRAFQSSSASATEKATMYARDKNKLDISSKEQSSSQPSQKVGTSSKTLRVFQSSSASPTEKATMFAREKNKLELSKEQTSSQPSQKVGISSKTVRAFQSSSASAIEKATMYARDKNKLDFSSKEQSSSQPSHKVGTSSKTIRAFQSSSASPTEKATMFGREKNKLEFLREQSSSQPLQKVGTSSKTMRAFQSSSACPTEKAFMFAREKNKLESLSKEQSSSQPSQKVGTSSKTMMDLQSSSASATEKAFMFAREKNKMELSSKEQSSSQPSQKVGTLSKTVNFLQSSSASDPVKATLAKESSKMELSSKVQSCSCSSQTSETLLKNTKALQSSAPSGTDKTTFFAKERSKMVLSSKMQSSSNFSQEFSKSINTVKSGQSATVSEKLSPVSNKMDKTELLRKEESCKQLSQNAGESVATIKQPSPAVAYKSLCPKDSGKEDSLDDNWQEDEKDDVMYTRSGKRFTQLEDPEFITEFYRHSKYHLMSLWRTEHKSFVKKLRSTEDRKFPGLEKFKIFMNTKDSGTSDKLQSSNGNTASTNSACSSGPSQHVSVNHVGSNGFSSEDKAVIMHVDMDCFFVAVSLMKFPELQGKPLAVAHAGAKPFQNTWFEDFDRSFFEKKKWKSRSSECVEISHKERVTSSQNGLNDEGGQSGTKQGQNMAKTMSEWEATYYNCMAEISSCSYEAREAGVEKGMLLADAVTLCPNLLTLPYDFEKYHEISRLLYEAVASFTDDIEAVSCDEMFLDITKILRETGATPMEVAHFIRDEIKAKTQCTASAGIASNTLLARLCTRVAKPNGIFQLEDDKVEDFMKKWPVRDLPGIGESIGKKLLANFGIDTCADLQQLSLSSLQKEFGPKTGQVIYQSCRGQTQTPIRMEKERKYVSVDVNFGIRFKNEEELLDFIYRMADEMHKRLKDLKMAGRKVTIKLKVRRPSIPKNSVEDSRFLGTGEYDSKYRSVTLPQETDDLGTIKREFKNIYLSIKVDPTDVRGVGVQLSRLKKVSSLLGVTKSLEEMLPKKSDVPKTSPPTSPDKNLSTSKTSGKPRRYSLLNFVQPKKKSSSDEDPLNYKSDKINESFSSTDESELDSSSASQGTSCNSREEIDSKEEDGNTSQTAKIMQLLSVDCNNRNVQDRKETQKCESKEENLSKITRKDESELVEGNPSKIAKCLFKNESRDESQFRSLKAVDKSESKEGSPEKDSTEISKNTSRKETSTKCTPMKHRSDSPNSKSGRTYTQVSDPEFLSQFYQNSKFHHISTWKVEHQTFINDLQKKEDQEFPGKRKLQMFTNTEDAATTEKKQDSKEDSATEHSISQTYFGSGRTIFDQVGPERIVFENKSVILHIDMDCFFVSVSLLNFPELRGMPLAVAHTGVKSSQGMSVWLEDFERAYLEKKLWNNSATKCVELTRKERVNPYGTVQDEDEGEQLKGKLAAEFAVKKPLPSETTYLNSMAEIASCSYEAREAGVENGMLLVEAKALCPELRTVPYDFEKYHKVSRVLYETVASFTNEIEAVSCDEMFVDITKILRDTGATPTEFAQLVRDEIFAKTQCTASVGIASNTLLARLCMKKAKPNGIFLLEDSKVNDFMKTVPVRDLPGIGEAISQKLLVLGVSTCGEMQQLSLTALQRQFGTRTGHDLYNHCRGKNDQPIKTERVLKLVSSTVNYGIRFKTNDDALKFVFELAEVVHKKLQKTGMKGRTIMLKLKIRRKGTPQEELKFMGHGVCENKTRTISLRQETDDLAIIKRESRALYWQMQAPPRDIRGVGLHITRLKKANSASSKSLIDMLPKKSDLSKSPTSASPKSPISKTNLSSSNSSTFPAFFSKRRKDEPRYFFPDDDDDIDDEVFTEEEKSYKVTGKKDTSSSPSIGSSDKCAFSPRPKTMFGSSPIKREREGSDSSSYSSLNSPSNLDPEVLNSLPPDIRREVLEEEMSKVKKTQNVVEKLGHVEDLPSFSKIDPSCLDALPKEIQGELLTAYRRKAALAAMKTPEKKLSTFQTQLSPVKAPKRKKSVPKERPKKVEYEKPSWQRNIFEALNLSSQHQHQYTVKVKKTSQNDEKDCLEKVIKKET